MALACVTKELVCDNGKGILAVLFYINSRTHPWSPNGRTTVLTAFLQAIYKKKDLHSRTVHNKSYVSSAFSSLPKVYNFIV